MCFVERAFDGNKMEGGERGSTLFIRLIVRAEIKNRSPHTPPPLDREIKQTALEWWVITVLEIPQTFCSSFSPSSSPLSSSSSSFSSTNTALSSWSAVAASILYLLQCLLPPYLICRHLRLLLLLFDFLRRRHPVYFSFVAFVFFFIVIILFFVFWYLFSFCSNVWIFL